MDIAIITGPNTFEGSIETQISMIRKSVNHLIVAWPVIGRLPLNWRTLAGTITQCPFIHKQQVQKSITRIRGAVIGQGFSIQAARFARLPLQKAGGGGIAQHLSRWSWAASPILGTRLWGGYIIVQGAKKV
jgi:hypothetical protein